jgi:hypothetical protein
MIGDGKLGATTDTIDGVDAIEKTRMTLLQDRLRSICKCKRYFGGRACIELGARILFVLSFAPTGTSGFDRETKNACIRLIYELFPGQPLGFIDTFLEASYAWKNRRGDPSGKRILYGAQFAEQDTELLNEELQLCSDAGMTIVTLGAVACAALLAAAEGQCNDVAEGQSIITKFRPGTDAYHITTGVAPRNALQNMTCDEYLVALSMSLSTTPCPPSQSPPARPVPNTKYRALGVVEWGEKDAAHRLYQAKLPSGSAMRRISSPPARPTGSKRMVGFRPLTRSWCATWLRRRRRCRNRGSFGLPWLLHGLLSSRGCVTYRASLPFSSPLRTSRRSRGFVPLQRQPVICYRQHSRYPTQSQRTAVQRTGRTDLGLWGG